MIGNMQQAREGFLLFMTSVPLKCKSTFVLCNLRESYICCCGNWRKLWDLNDGKLTVIWNTQMNMQAICDGVNLLLRGCKCVTGLGVWP